MSFTYQELFSYANGMKLSPYNTEETAQKSQLCSNQAKTVLIYGNKAVNIHEILYGVYT